MRLALVADIHGNLHALEAVLQVVSAVGADRVVCLGDLVGYNAFPGACIELAQAHFDRVVMGNHDREVAGSQPTVGTTTSARAAQQWTRAQLSASEIAWLAGLPNRDLEPGQYMGVHGCFLNPEHINGYVTQTMLEANLLAIAGRADWPNLAFCGHTHMPMLAGLVDGLVVELATDQVQTFPKGATAVLVNPGSVGQPRDFDCRASFCIVDTDAHTVEVTRVPYDVQAAADAVLAAGLPEGLASRLLIGR